MSYYLIDHPPARSQYRTTRRAKPTGAVVLHTAESALDLIGPDAGAENVARFISRRTSPGSYHSIGDRDSIVRMVPYSYEAWQDGTGSNPWAIGISLAMRAADWRTIDAKHAHELVTTMAAMAADAARWLRDEHDITVPARRLTKAQSDAGQPGFIAHADRDPGRRSDPGRRFPWDAFLTEYAAQLKGSTMPTDRSRLIAEGQQALNANGATLVVDGDYGPLTNTALHDVLQHLNQRITELESEPGEIPDDVLADAALGVALRELHEALTDG